MDDVVSCEQSRSQRCVQTSRLVLLTAAHTVTVCNSEVTVVTFVITTEMLSKYVSQ